jgi:hypothetical protein
LLHQPGALDLTRGFKLFVLYPLIPVFARRGDALARKRSCGGAE